MQILFNIDFHNDKDMLQQMFKDWWKEIRDADSLENIRWGKTAKDNKLEFSILGYQEYQDLLAEEAASLEPPPDEKIDD